MIYSNAIKDSGSMNNEPIPIRLASLSQRVSAMIIDHVAVVLGWIIGFALSWAFYPVFKTQFQAANLVGCFFAICVVIYDVILEARFGQGIGKRHVQIRVEALKYNNSARVVYRAICRWSFIVLGLLLLLVQLLIEVNNGKFSLLVYENYVGNAIYSAYAVSVLIASLRGENALLDRICCTEVVKLAMIARAAPRGFDVSAPNAS